MLSFKSSRWYWRHDDGRIYASARHEIITGEDEAFQAFHEANGFVTRWPVDETAHNPTQALAEVLAPYGLSFGQPTLVEVKAKLEGCGRYRR